jgi:photosystem II stability/assembly factor-like uncharacterized protein
MGDYVYAGAAKWSAARSEDHGYGLFRLDPDVGEWEALGDRPKGGLPDTVGIHHLAFSQMDPSLLYAGTHAGPYKSQDGGDSWEALSLPTENCVTWSLLPHPSDPNILYAGTEDQGVYRTTDGGKSWDALPVPKPEGYCYIGFPSRTVRMALDPSNPDEIYVGVEVGGLLRSLDGGDSWEDGGGDLFRLSKEEYPDFPDGKGDIVGMMDTHSVTCNPALPGTVFYANRFGLYRSDDKAQTFRNLDVGRFSHITYSRDVQTSRHDPNRLYAAFSFASVSDEGSLWKSDDQGESWQRFDHGVSVDSTMMHIAQSPTNAERVYCGARRGQVFGTEDGGKSWREFRLPDGVEGLYAVAAV